MIRKPNGDVEFGPYPAGMNNRQPDYALPDGALRNGVNVDIDNRGYVSRRSGYSKVLGGLNVHSGWSCALWTLFVKSGRLNKLNTDNTSTELMPVAGPVCYYFVADTVYFSDGAGAYKLLSSGQIVKWGIDPPSVSVLSVAAGVLPAGTYLVATTFVGADGSESGASDVVSIIVSSPASIIVLLPFTTDKQVAHVRVYSSPANGELLYAIADIPVGVSSYTITADGQGKELDTIGIKAMPPGSAIDSYNGRMYVVSGTELWYSEPFAYDWLRPATNFFQFSDPISIIASVPTGFWVVADKTYFYTGMGPEQFVAYTKAEYGAPFGQSYHIPNSSDVVWYSDRGIIRAGDGVMNLQEENVATETGDSAAIIVRESDGIQQVVASIHNAVVSPLVSQSFLSMEVVRKAGG